MKKQSGFAAVEGIIVVVIVAAVAVVGYYVIHNNSTATPTTASTYSSGSTAANVPPVTTPVAPQITTASDLNSAMRAINGTSVSSNNVDNSQLTTQSQSL